MIRYVLQSKTANLFWSCNYGWTYLDYADLYSYEEMMVLSDDDYYCITHGDVTSCCSGDWRILTEEGLEDE